MRNFYYKAVDKEGNSKEGIITAISDQDAIVKIKGQGLYLTEIYQTAKKDYSKGFSSIWESFILRLVRPRIKMKQLVPFVSDLAVLCDSGISLVKALTILYNQTISRRLKRIIRDLRSDVESGQSLSDGLSKHPECFSKLFINMVHAGEIGGVLGGTLDRLASLYEKTLRLEGKLKTALIYPIFVLLFALVVVIFIVAFIIPKFFVIFADVGTKLPLPTMMLYHISLFLRERWIFLAVVFLVGIGVLKILMHIKRVQFIVDVVKIRLPVFGIIFKKVSISRFCRTFGTLLISGVPILQTLSVAKEATGNMVYEQAIEQVKGSIKEGESIAGPLSHYANFPPLVTNMITVGEETGALSQMLLKISDRYDDEVDVLVSQLSSLLEPFLIVGLGIIVAFIVISLFLPLVSIVENLTGL